MALLPLPLPPLTAESGTITVFAGMTCVAPVAVFVTVPLTMANAARSPPCLITWVSVYLPAKVPTGVPAALVTSPVKGTFTENWGLFGAAEAVAAATALTGRFTTPADL